MKVLEALLARRQEFLGFARARLRTEADAEDVVQQALLKASTHLESVREPEHGVAWFYRILRNTLSDHRLATNRRTRRLEALAREPEEAPPLEPTTCACTLGVLAKLSPERRQLLERVDLEGTPLAEVATELGITPGAAKVRLHRARNGMREAMFDFCGTTSFRACLDCHCD